MSKIDNDQESKQVPVRDVPVPPTHLDLQSAKRRRSNGGQSTPRSTSSTRGSMCEPIEGWEELDRRKLGCDYDRPSDFVVSQWPIIPWPIFIFYRLISACYTVGVFVLVLMQADWNHVIYWWAYYMYWSHLMLMASSITALAVGIFARIKIKGQTGTPVNTVGSDDDLSRNSQVSSPSSSASPGQNVGRHRSDDERLPLKQNLDNRSTLAKRIDSAYGHKLHWTFKMFWFFRNVAYNQSLVMSFFFWTLLYDYIRHTPGELQTNQVIVDALLVILDSILSAAPVRFLHAWQPIVFAIGYVILSVIFWFVGGATKAKPYFFKVFDYKSHPVLSGFVIVFLVTVMIPTAQFFLVCLGNLRKFFFSCMEENKYCTCAGCQKQSSATTAKSTSR